MDQVELEYSESEQAAEEHLRAAPTPRHSVSDSELLKQRREIEATFAAVSNDFHVKFSSRHQSLSMM